MALKIRVPIIFGPRPTRITVRAKYANLYEFKILNSSLALMVNNRCMTKRGFINWQFCNAQNFENFFRGGGTQHFCFLRA